MESAIYQDAKTALLCRYEELHRLTTDKCSQLRAYMINFTIITIMLTLNYIVYQNVHLDVGFPYYNIFGTKCKGRSSVDIKGCLLMCDQIDL